METLDITEVNFMVDDDILNFALDDENKETKTIFKAPFASSSSSLELSNQSTVNNPETQSGSFPEYEEELEWLSNKEAFPEVETCFGILRNEPELMLNRQSPVSVLENNSSSKNATGNNSGSTVVSCCGNFEVPKNYPVRARSNRKRRRVALGNMTSQQCLWLDQVNVKKSRQESPVALPPSPMTTNNGATMGRKCLHCQVDKTPQWRAGPMGPKTLCNACGVRYKSGRLFPEYRPASSPTFSNALHSNSHRKVIEMRRQKQLSTGGVITVSEACGYIG